ncbi:hypothetical protein RU89_GL000304 [Lactococcus cremoris]|nr:hypothetical protein RU89_GL000304 [Lactococcus cremoris]
MVPFRQHIKKGECTTNKNKFFQYTVTLDTSHNIFRASLANDSSIYGAGDTIEEAVQNLEQLV